MKFILLAAASAAALSLAACNKPAETTAADAAATGAAAVNTAQDATAAAVGTTSASTMGSHDTGAFVSNAAQSDMYEIEAGKMAATRAKSADVKAFGKMMVDAHTKMSADMKPLITAAGETLPAGLDERRQGLLDNLKAASDADFDKVYLSQQEAAHNEALTLMQGYASNGSDAGLKGGAATAVPMVQMHLDKVKALMAAMPKT